MSFNLNIFVEIVFIVHTYGRPYSNDQKIKKELVHLNLNPKTKNSPHARAHDSTLTNHLVFSFLARIRINLLSFFIEKTKKGAVHHNRQWRCMKIKKKKCLHTTRTKIRSYVMYYNWNDRIFVRVVCTHFYFIFIHRHCRSRCRVVFPQCDFLPFFCFSSTFPFFSFFSHLRRATVWPFSERNKGIKVSYFSFFMVIWHSLVSFFCTRATVQTLSATSKPNFTWYQDLLLGTLV